MNKIMKTKKLCYIASIGLAACLAHNVTAQSSWIDTDLNGLWDDPNNWSGGAPSDAAGWVVTINPAPGPTCTILASDIEDVGTLSDNASTYGTVYGPEFGANLNIYGTLDVDWTIAPVQNNPDPAARSYLNMYSGSLLETSGASINLGDAWWWTGGPYVTMNMYGNAQYQSLGGAGLWLGGHLNIYDTASFSVNGYVNMDTAESQSDGTRSINLGGGTLTLPEGFNATQVPGYITRGILRAYGKGEDTADLIITDNGANTIVTTKSLGGSLQKVYFQPALESSVYIGTFQQLVLVGDYPEVTGVYLSSSEPGLDPASFPAPVYTSSDTCVLTVDANGVATAVGPGKATVTATVGSFVAGNPVTITVLRIPSLVHRYSFTGSGTSVADTGSSPTSAATLQGGATLGGGQVTLDGQTGYVQLPAGIASGMDEMTVETWASFGNPINIFANLFCFGYSDQTGDPNNGFGGDYINVVPNSGGTTTQVSFGQGLPGFNDEWDAGIPNTLDGANNVHVVAVFHPFANTEDLYINGALVANNTMCNNLLDPVAFAGPTYNSGSYLAYTLGTHAIQDEAGNEVVADPDNFIGWDDYQGNTYGTPAEGGTGDPTLNGSVAEFRIYSGPLTASQIAADYVLGPARVIGSVTTVGLSATLSGGNIVITWPISSAYVTLVSTPLPINGNNCWTPVTDGTLTIVGSNYQETVPASGVAVAFGLQ
jgi:hypothetical protein